MSYSSLVVGRQQRRISVLPLTSVQTMPRLLFVYVFVQTMPRLFFVFVYLSLIRQCEGCCVSFCVFVSVQTMQRWLCLYFCICIFVNRTCVNLCLVQNVYHFVLRQKFLISLIIIFYGYKNMICIITIFFYNNK